MVVFYTTGDTLVLQGTQNCVLRLVPGPKALAGTRVPKLVSFRGPVTAINLPILATGSSWPCGDEARRRMNEECSDC
eukprot:819266-Rhodomonas_salina.5